MPIQLEPVDLEHLPRAPLRLALVQVLYRPVLAIEAANEMLRFEEALGADWKLLERSTAQQVQFEFGPGGARQSSRPAETVWRFADSDDRFQLAVSHTSLGLESALYHAFDEFGEKMRSVVKALGDVFQPVTQTRLGVRYINEIDDARLGEPEWLTFFLNEDLVRPVGAQLGLDLLASLTELRFRQPDGTFVLRHGLVEAHKYLIDFDYFIEREQPFSKEAVVSTAEAFHRVIETVFCWAVAAGYLDELRAGGTE